MEEKDYRKKVSEIFNRLANSVDSVDPDIAEAELSQGSLIILTGKTKTILSPQPSVRQIWLAAAALGIAAHFSFDEKSEKWLDDKGQGLELLTFTADVLKKTAGIELSL